MTGEGRGGGGQGRALEQRPGPLQAGTEGRGSGCGEQTAGDLGAFSPQSLCPDVGRMVICEAAGPSPRNGGPIAHFQSGPVPSTQAELIKHSLPSARKWKATS